jgi:hypothetical protein
MASLVLMYVFYDKNGDIKAITPGLDPALSAEFSVATFPLPEVEMFLLGQRNPFDFSIKKILRAGGDKVKIVRKEYEVNLTRTLDNYLTQVEPLKDQEPIIRIILNLYENSIKIHIDPLYKDLLTFGSEDEQDDVQAFINSPQSVLYFTKRNNPYHLLYPVVFSPKELFDKQTLEFDIGNELDLSNSSVYTKKLVNSYGYKIKGKKNVI